MMLIWGNEGLNIRFYVRDSKKTQLCMELRVLVYFVPKFIQGPVASCKNRNNEKTSRVNTFGVQSHACTKMKPIGGS